VCDRVLSELALFEQFTRGKYVKRSASVGGIRVSKPMEVVTINNRPTAQVGCVGC